MTQAAPGPRSGRPAPEDAPDPAEAPADHPDPATELAPLPGPPTQPPGQRAATAERTPGTAPATGNVPATGNLPGTGNAPATERVPTTAGGASTAPAPGTAPVRPAGPARPADSARPADPRRRWAGFPVALVHTAAALLTAAALGWTLWCGFRQPGTAVSFGLFVALGVALYVPLPGDREATPLAVAGALGYALLGEVDGVPAEHGPLQAVAVTGGGLLLGLVPQVVRGRAPEADVVVRRLLTVGWVAGCFQVLRAGSLGGLTAGVGAADEPWSYPCVLLVLLALGALGDALLAAVLTAARTGRRHRVVFGQELRAMAGIGSAIAATGTVIALAVATAGLWALPVCAVPLLLTQLSFRRYAEVRATCRQTIASLARATEVAGHTPPGHARRVAALSRAVGRELGMAEPDLTVLEYAALMHDIGQLSLLDPLAEGATEPLRAAQRRRIALLGGAVVRQTGVSPEVAVVVECQADPYREQPLTARVVRAVNAFVELTPEGDGPAAECALGRLRRATARDFDPRVVEAVAKVASRGRPA